MHQISRSTGELALNAMLLEAAATPKPGLVDRNNTGAHRDMDFLTFMSSAAALHAAFDEFTRIGARTGRRPPDQAFRLLRESGIRAEQAMFAATSGVNTHKGMLFSLGLVCGAIGRIHAREPLTATRICETAAELAGGLCGEAFSRLGESAGLTKGEKVYLEYGLTGVRGEAESGFATVRSISYPVMKALLAREHSLNDIFIQTLLHLIAAVADTNIVSRHNPDVAEYARERARDVLAQGGIFAPAGKRLVREMDRDFIRRRISPGGSADLLAVTYLLIQAEEKICT